MKDASAKRLWEQIETFAAYGFNKCLAGDTRIFDAETGIPTSIDALVRKRAAPLIYALAKDEKLKTTRASLPFENGIKPLYKLTTRSGKIIRATANHPFLTWNGWQKLDALAVGQRIAAPRRIPEPMRPRPLISHEAATLGYLLSEGNVCHPHGIYFYSTMENEVCDFIEHATKFPNSKITIDRSKAAVSVYVGQVNPKLGNALHTWVREIGLAGKKATQKNVPAVVYNSDNASLAVFLGKLWQGDGTASIQNQQLFYATSSRRLAEDVQNLLLRFSIISTIHTKKFKYRGALMPGWTVVITGAENLTAFKDHINPHLIGTKRKRVEIVAANAHRRSNNRGRGTTDTIPAEIFILVQQEVNAYGGAKKMLAAQAGISQRILFADRRKRGYTRTVINYLANTLGSSQLALHGNSDIFWDEVVSIEPDSEEMTYDLSVPGPENFIADGLIVHNSHAVSYGNLAYQTAYMKAHYPVDYMAALLTADAGDVEEIGDIVAECKRMGIAVLAPDVNESMRDFTVVGDMAIRFGLSSIKNFGEGVAQSIIDVRAAGGLPAATSTAQAGQFTSLSDFLARVTDKNLNKKSLEAIIQSGALDNFGERGAMLGNIEALLAHHKDHASGSADQDSLFGGSSKTNDIWLESAPKASFMQKLTWEKELLGLYISGHPLDAHRAKLEKQKFDIATTKEKLPPDTQTTISGIIEYRHEVLTKNGEKMAFITIADYGSTIETVAFPRVLKEYGGLLATGNCVIIKGRISQRNGEISFVAEAVKPL